MRQQKGPKLSMINAQMIKILKQAYAPKKALCQITNRLLARCSLKVIKNSLKETKTTLSIQLKTEKMNQ